MIEKIKKENKNKVVNYICPIFRLAKQTFNGSYKRNMKQIKDERYIWEISTEANVNPVAM